MKNRKAKLPGTEIYTWRHIKTSWLCANCCDPTRPFLIRAGHRVHAFIKLLLNTQVNLFGCP
jgi:hypothetical protein